MPRNIPDNSENGAQPMAADVADLLQAVAHRLRRETRETLGSAGVTGAQLRALRTLERLPGPTRMSALADELHIARRSATSVVDELEARRLVARGHDPLDRRAVTVEVTAPGQSLLAEVRDRRRHTTIGMLEVLSEEELGALRELLGRIVG